MLTFEFILIGKTTWNYPLLIVIILIAVIYLALIHRFAKEHFVPFQPISFFISCALFLFIAASPFAIISHLSFSLHMVQMSILYFIIPPLMMLGIPEQLLNQLPRFPKHKWLTLTRLSPKIALYTFATLFLLYHLPFILTIIAGNPLLKNGYLFLLFALSFSMWKPLASPDPLFRLCTCKMKRYAFISGVAITPACLLFIGSAFLGYTGNPLFDQLIAHLCGPANLDALPIMPWPFNTKYDQVLAGFLMIGLHKLSLFMTLRLERKISIHFYEELESEVEKRCV